MPHDSDEGTAQARDTQPGLKPDSAPKAPPPEPEPSSLDAGQTPTQLQSPDEGEASGPLQTIQLSEPLAGTHTPRWGDALLGGRATLRLTIQGHERAPVMVTVRERVIVGRADTPLGEGTSVDLTPYDAQAKGVSRQHAAILKDGNTLKVVDLGSTNGTYLNGMQLSPHQPRILRDGDEVGLGTLLLKVAFVAQK